MVKKQIKVGSLLHSKATGALYRISSVEGRKVVLVSLLTNTEVPMSFSRLVVYLESGDFWTLNGLQMAQEMARQVLGKKKAKL